VIREAVAGSSVNGDVGEKRAFQPIRTSKTCNEEEDRVEIGEIGDEAEVDSIGLASRNSFIADLLEVSWKNARARGDFEQGLRPSIYPISSALTPVLIVLRLLGLFPGFLRVGGRRKRRVKRIVVRIGFLLTYLYLA